MRIWTATEANTLIPANKQQTSGPGACKQAEEETTQRGAGDDRQRSGLRHLSSRRTMLQVRDLRTSILKPASFSLSAGEAIAVRGPSGAGKTLLLRAVADLDPGAGLVTLDRRDRSTIAGPEWRRLVGYV